MIGKKQIAIAAALVVTLAAGSCQDDAAVASKNLSKAADNFEINRRIVFYNGITDQYILTIEGRCAIDTNDSGTSFFVTCKTSENQFKKHFLDYPIM